MNLTFLTNELLESIYDKELLYFLYKKHKNMKSDEDQFQREMMIVQRILEDGNRAPRWNILLRFQSLGFPVDLIIDDLNRLIGNKIIESNLSAIGVVIFTVI